VPQSHLTAVIYNLIKDIDIQRFVDTLRSNSGLLIEIGQGLFSFVHRTFQEYFVALYLLRKPIEELEQFVPDHYLLDVWREPLLLTIAYKSMESSQGDRHQASKLIQTIVDRGDDRNTVLHPTLLFAASCVAGCNAWSIDKTLQESIANNLFYIYDDVPDSGLNRQLQKKIEEVVLLWLQGQPAENNLQNIMSPLLAAWRTALCNPNLTKRLQGAVHLLATLAPDLYSCPKSVLLALIPPLLQLSDLLELPCPPEIQAQLSQIAAHPSSLRVEEYAFVALRLLDAIGPAGWLHAAWLKWNEEQPELLEHLTQHSLELDYLLTPVALPKSSNVPNLKTQLKITRDWQEQSRKNPRELQTQLLQAGDAACYPYAYLLKQMLDRELTASSPSPDPSFSWHSSWDSFLREEKARGCSATYQQCLVLQLLLWKGNDEYRQKIADELISALAREDKQEAQVVVTISNIYRSDLQELPELRELPDLRYISLPEKKDTSEIWYLQEVQDIHYFLHLRDLKYSRYLLDLRDLLNLNKIVNSLCNILERPVGSVHSEVLFALYTIINSVGSLSPSIKGQIEDSIHYFEKQEKVHKRVNYALSTAIVHRLKDALTLSFSPTPTPIKEIPDVKAATLQPLKQQDRLTKQQVEELLTACTDSRQLFEKKWEEMRIATVSQIAWELLTQQFSLELESLPIVMRALDDQDARLCAAAALLLQHSTWLPQNIRKEAAEKISIILGDDMLSRRLLDSSGSSRSGSLEDVLFETLEILTE
jgi:hypothetical protein